MQIPTICCLFVDGMYHAADGGVDFTNELALHRGQLVLEKSYCLRFVEMLTMFKVDEDVGNHVPIWVPCLWLDAMKSM